MQEGAWGLLPIPAVLSAGLESLSDSARPEVTPVLCPSPVPPRLGMKAEDEAQVLLSFISFHLSGTPSFCLLARGHG